VPADLDQFGQMIHMAQSLVGKVSVELGHHPSDGARPLDQVNEITGIRQIERGLHAGYAAPTTMTAPTLLSNMDYSSLSLSTKDTM